MRWRLKKGEASWTTFNKALTRYFGQAPTIAELTQIVEEKLGSMVDLDDRVWFYRGFRASVSEGKGFLILQGGKETKVAMIDDIAVFRDAHPGAVYLGRRGDRFGSYITAKLEPHDVDVILVMKDHFSLAACDEQTPVIFDHQRTENEIGACVFWLCPSVILRGSLEDFLLGWGTKRDLSQRGIVEVIL